MTLREFGRRVRSGLVEGFGWGVGLVLALKLVTWLGLAACP